MDQINRQTETRDIRLEHNSGKRIVSVLFGIVEIILGLRLIFKLLGANADNGFIKVIYSITQLFVGIFEGIFSVITINEANNAVFEPATLIAIILVALIVLLVLKLMSPRISNRVERTQYTDTESVNQNSTDNNQNSTDNNQQNSTDNNQQNRM